MTDKPKIIIEVEEDYIYIEKEQKKTVRVLSFMLGEESYGVSVTDIREMIRLEKVTRVPNVPEFVVGVMNLRGEIIAVLDLKYFLGLSGRELSKDSMVIMTDIKGAMMGLLVDKMKESLDVEEAAIQPPLGTVKREIAEYTKGVVELADSILILLDLAKILSAREIEQLKKQ